MPLMPKPPKIPTDPFERLIQALNHPMRRRILRAATGEHVSATSLKRLFNDEYQLGSIAYHLGNVLCQQLEVVEPVGSRKRRGATERFYTLRIEAFVGVVPWPELPNAVADFLTEASAVNFVEAIIGADLARMRGKGSVACGWRPILLDGEGRQELGQAVAEFTGRVEDAEMSSAARAGGDRMELTPSVVGAAAFPMSEAAGE